jgi:hypothetical protein
VLTGSGEAMNGFGSAAASDRRSGRAGRAGGTATAAAMNGPEFHRTV